ncbi:hypothetical protein [uncultured Faecalibaculum sp.]|uniref:hypothetical protein n=1 Tax=uncultured Faecalibaculum sp. TaxID=1729681 RepID=UPI0025E566CB|nr:hypothetical protein [uncultured Faecalibaculum sp.]
MLYKKLTTVVVAASCMLPYTHSYIFAESMVNPPSINQSIDTNTVEFGDGYITEEIYVNLGDHTAFVKYTTYSDDSAKVVVEENGVISEFTCNASYSKLLDNLKNSGVTPQTGNPILRGRVAGYNYRYMKSVSQTEYCTPQNATYSAILGAVSAVLGIQGLPGSVATGVASLIYGSISAPVETKIVTTRNWYEMTEKASGGFIGYHCEFVVGTYVRNSSGGWNYLGAQTGEFDSFDVY